MGFFIDISKQEAIFDVRADRDCFTIWDRWQPACDSCGRAESKDQRLMSCSYCRVAKYCSDKCQKHDWAAGNHHKRVCHLYEVDKKLSDTYIQTPKYNPFAHFYLNSLLLRAELLDSFKDPKLSLRDKVAKWGRLHYNNIVLIKTAVFKDNPELKKTLHLGVFIKLVGTGPDYDHRSFLIDKLALMPWRDRDSWSWVEAGYCVLPDGTSSGRGMNVAAYRTREDGPLPP
ncbi:hypothetical protein C8R46DRAFT_1120519, partial [Mycena filopes]